MPKNTSPAVSLPRWARAELNLESTVKFNNPLQEARFYAVFTTPSKQERVVEGFWDGGNTWRARIAPDELGEWQVALHLAKANHEIVQSKSGAFVCRAAAGETPFENHGPVRLAANKRYLEHTDGTPFFWLADTAWNGPLRATDEEWALYLRERQRQKFTVIQWVATQWRAAPAGDNTGRLAFTGNEQITINPAFFQKMDQRVKTIARAGLLSAPVLLWAIGAGANPQINPGFGLPEDQAIKLARYMLARWSSYPVVWILAGDSNYLGERAERWRRIGQAVFGDHPHAPVAMHCGGQQWPAEEFRREPWLDILGYQSGHGDSDETWRWLAEGPPARDWAIEPRLFQLNLEPAYENHVAYHSHQQLTPSAVRRAVYWSLLNSPTAGVTYGGHGVWGWDDGSGPSVDHPNSGTPLPWQAALTMPGAEQMAHVRELFTNIEWWRLRPAPMLIVEQPGIPKITDAILASQSETGDLVVAYIPTGGTVSLRTASLRANLRAAWLNPRTGERTLIGAVDNTQIGRFQTPDPEDWVLLLTK
ncbi:MAG: DUF4038 domain-containing protein [Chloroflexi bacterium]|nr:DUF4038 domain-containing protein [Chloroflexota bacterium]